MCFKQYYMTPIQALGLRDTVVRRRPASRCLSHDMCFIKTFHTQAVITTGIHAVYRLTEYYHLTYSLKSSKGNMTA